MSLIKPGIHENLVISPKTTWNDKGSYDLVIKSSESADAELAAFMGNTISTSMESTLKFYTPNLVDYDKNVKTSGDLGEELRIIRFQFIQYGSIFAPKETVESYIGGMKMFEGIGVAPENYGKAIAQLTNEAFLATVFKNLCTKFHALLVATKAMEGKVTFRQKFLRQSKDKNWAVIPTSDISLWIEPMTVPKEQSKVAFTEWEINNGKNDPNPSAASPAASTQADVNAGRQLFGAPATNAAPPIMAPPPAMPTQSAPIPPVFTNPVTTAEAYQTQPDLVPNTPTMPPVTPTPPVFTPPAQQVTEQAAPVLTPPVIPPMPGQ